MHPDLIQRFDRASTPQAAARLWGADPATLTHVGDGRNFVYRFRHPGGQFCFLRLAHESHRQRQHIEAELQFVRHLDRCGCALATPVPSTAGHWVHTLASKPLGSFHATAFWEVHGQAVKWGDDAENREVLRERGRALGQIHRASADFQPSGPTRFRWDEDPVIANAPAVFGEIWDDDEPLRREYEAVRQWIASQPVDQDSFGLVHGDPLSSNFLRSGGRSIAFDFDDCCYHWFYFDLAVAISAGRNLPEKYRQPYLQCLIDGYREVRPVPADVNERITWFARLAALNRYATYVQEWAARSKGDASVTAELARRRQAVIEPARWS
jgi:amicoumacin kinase